MMLRRMLSVVVVLVMAGCGGVPARAPLPEPGGHAEPRSAPGAGGAAAGQGASLAPSARWAPAHVVVFAPHPDDETLGAGGVLLKAAAAGQRAHVVIFTNGDGYPHSASLLVGKPEEALGPADYLELARVRQLEVYGALGKLGLTPDDVTFLGYPDAGLDQVYQAKGEEPFTQRFTGKSATYGMTAPDFHSLVHGTAAPYRYTAVLADVVDLLGRLRPQAIYVTHERDTHPDHQAAHWFVRDAIQAVGYTGQVFTYLIHDGPGWPWPDGATPTKPYASHQMGDVQVPRGAQWPPPVRGALTEQEALRKLAAIRAYSSQLAVAPVLAGYAKAEEIFWYLGAP